ncbi:MAG: hypothetical protein M2R45_04889 [Verrucomicrobia subdivision 3 bacterium]|nr:hypothetical protein [Limisphaerales bacterium]MCS1414383.1 hypothetical protein [Limisphaerales bacterium]
MFDKLRDTIAHIKQSRPGSRFIDYYAYRKKRKNESTGKHIAMILLGLALVAIGFIGTLLPIIPGFVFGIPGIAILGSRSKTAAKSLDAAERIFHRIRQRHRERSSRAKRQGAEESAPRKPTKP